MDDSQNEYDSLKDVIEFQQHQFNPGYYIGTGKVPPTISAPGNALPIAVGCFLAVPPFLAFGLFLFFSDANVTSAGLIESPLGNKILALVTFTLISLFFLFYGFVYLKKVKRFYKEKKAMNSEPVDETVQDEIWQRICPECGEKHDLDYPKCPHCGHNYLNID
ncbi:MAG: hypothetical protein J5662_00735 [Clostridia bacterium]|nr:hypothetical protein [Clostridia bacterium]